MKKQNLLLILLLAISISFVSCGKKVTANENGCFISMEDGAVNANKKKQNILLVITTGTDDEFSKNFIENVLSTEEFKNQIASKYSVVNFDFSEETYTKTVDSEEFADVMYRNARVASILNVQAAPAIYFFTPEKYFITEVYLDDYPFSVSSLEAAISDCEDTVKSINQLVKETKKGSAEKRVVAIDTLFEATDSIQKTFLGDLIEEVIKLDKNNKTGLVSKYIVANANAKASEAFLEGKIDDAIQAFVTGAKEKFIEPGHAQQLYYMAAYVLIMSESTDTTQISAYLQKAIDAAPESEAVPEIEAFKSYVLGALSE